jgi:hypothetical protein
MKRLRTCRKTDCRMKRLRTCCKTDCRMKWLRTCCKTDFRMKRLRTCRKTDCRMKRLLTCRKTDFRMKRLRTCRKTDYRMKRLRTCRKTDCRMNECIYTYPCDFTKNSRFIIQQSTTELLQNCSSARNASCSAVRPRSLLQPRRETLNETATDRTEKRLLMAMLHLKRPTVSRIYKNTHTKRHSA